MFLSYIKEFLRFARVKAGIALFLLVFLGLMQGIGLLMLIPFLHLAGVTDTGGSSAGIVAWIRDLFQNAGLSLSLPTVLCAYVGITALHSIATRYQAVLNAGIEHGLTRFLSNRLYESLTHADWLFITRKRAADITHILTTELQRVGSGTYYFLVLAGTGVIAAVHVALAFMLSVPMTAIALGCSALLVLFLKPYNRKARSTGESLFSTIEGLYTTVMEHLSGMKVAKSYTAEDRHVRGFKSLTGSIATEFIRFRRLTAETRMVYDIGAVVAISIFFFIAVEVVHMPVANLLLLIFLFARLLPKFSLLHESYQQIIIMLPAFSAAMELQRQCTEARESRPSASVKPVRLEQGIEMCGVSFRYDSTQDHYALHKIDLAIPAHRITAIAGPSGAGKSTLADLIMGLLTPDDGAVLVDGASLTGERLHAWRQSVGYVPQESFLFHDTLRANLLWAQPGAGEDDLWWALELAAAKGFIGQMSHGLDTVVGDRGVRLSGGERQRIALARALLRKPSLLLLDEATSSLDLENERLIQDAIEHLDMELTIVIIAHRLSTIRRADLIVMLDQGRVVEAGAWKELAGRPDGRFQALLQAEGGTGISEVA